MAISAASLIFERWCLTGLDGILVQVAPREEVAAA